MNRAALTKTEVVFVIFVLCVLAGLLLPATQFPGRGARRVECLNNLKQIGLACHNHESTYKVLPNSGYDSGKQPNLIPTYLGEKLLPGIGNRQQAGWSYQILPFIEQPALWEGGEKNKTMAAKQAFAASGMVSGYFCPSRRRPVAHNGRGMIDYAAASTCSGLLADMENPDIDPGVDCAIVRNRNTLAQITADDVTSYSISMSGIRDGASNVMLISEKQMNVALVPPAADDDQGYVAGHDIDNVRTCFVPPQKDYSQPKEGPGAGSRVYRFGSSHPSVIVVVMCDGSVRTISYDIDQQTFFNLGRRNDGAKLYLD